MRRKIILFLLFCVVITLHAPPALADLVLSYDIPDALLDYTVSNKRLLVQESSDSDLILKLVDNESYVTLDNARVDGGDNFNLMVDLTMTQLGINNWSAAGTLKFTDTATGTNAVEAVVQSYSVSIAGGYLEIKGYLGDLNPSAILVNRGDPWVFAGNFDGRAVTGMNPNAIGLSLFEDSEI